MKNELLNEITNDAQSIRNMLPDVVLHGDGSLRDVDMQTVSNGEIVTTLFQARQAAHELYEKLSAVPRRKVGNGGDDE